MIHFTIEAARCYSCYHSRYGHGYGGGIWEYQLIRWLWHMIGLWSILVFAILIGGWAALKNWLGIESD